MPALATAVAIPATTSNPTRIKTAIHTRRSASVRIENGQERMRALQERHHPHCLLCGAQNNMGLQVPFRACENGSVTASLTLPAELQVIAALPTAAS